MIVNRTGYDHNVAGGYTTSYGRAANLSYTFNAVNQLTALTDADDAHYNATVSCDANNNITTVTETYSTTAIPPVVQSTLTTDFTYDALNRMTEHKTTRYDLGAGGSAALRGGEQFARTEARAPRNHTIDALGRVAKSSYSAYYQGDMPSVSNLEHVYAGASHVQNYDGASAYGAVWHWAGSSSGAGGSARHFHGSPLNSPNPDTASQKGYNIAALGGKNTPQGRPPPPATPRATTTTFRWAARSTASRREQSEPAPSPWRRPTGSRRASCGCGGRLVVSLGRAARPCAPTGSRSLAAFAHPGAVFVARMG